jgi:hypothetical protein
MPQHSLLNPDPGPQGNTDYSPEVALALRQAYAHVKRARTRADAYLKANDAILKYVPLPMAAEQRMRVYYILGVSLAGGDSFESALTWLDKAWQIAESLDDVDALVEIACQQGAANAQLLHLIEAVEDHFVCLNMLGRLRTIESTLAAQYETLELDIVLRLAMNLSLLGEFEAAEQHLSVARDLVRRVPDAKMQAATIHWIESNVCRWTNQLDRALRLALVAADLLEDASYLGYGRIQTVVAEIALDLAESFMTDAPSHAHDTYTQIAGPYIKRARYLARDGQDDPGECQAQLARARYDRIQGTNTDRTLIIRSVIRRAQRLKDMPILIQAYTELGEEFATRARFHELHGRQAEAKEMRTQARRAYQMAIDQLENADAIVLIGKARRGIRRLEEETDD